MLTTFSATSSASTEHEGGERRPRTEPVVDRQNDQSLTSDRAPAKPDPAARNRWSTGPSGHALE